MFLYDKKQDGKIDNPLEYLLNNCCISINSIFDKKIKIEKFKNLTFKFSTKDINVKIPMSGYYKYHYYLLRQLEIILNKVPIDDDNKKSINEYKNKLSTIISSLDEFKDIDIDNNMRNYETQLNTITTFTFDRLLNEIDIVIMCCTNKIDLIILNKSQKILQISTFQTNIDNLVKRISEKETAVSKAESYVTTTTTEKATEEVKTKKEKLDIAKKRIEIARNLLEDVNRGIIPNDLRLFDLYINLKIAEYRLDIQDDLMNVDFKYYTNSKTILDDISFFRDKLIPQRTKLIAESSKGLYEKVPENIVSIEITKKNIAEEALRKAETELTNVRDSLAIANSELKDEKALIEKLTAPEHIINNIPIYINANLNVSYDSKKYAFLLSYNDINYNRTYINYNVGDLIVNNKYELPNLIVNDDGDEFYLKLVDTVNIYITNLHVKSSFITYDNYKKLKILDTNNKNMIIDKYVRNR